MDAGTIAAYVAPVITLFVGAWLNRYFDKPQLISYMSFASSARIVPPNGQALVVNTHAIVIQNTGRKTANNVRIGHGYLPDFTVYPDTEHVVKNLPGGGKEIVFPQIVPKKQIYITYLYFPPLTFQGVNTHAESDEGPIKVVQMTPVVQSSMRNMLRGAAYGMGIGILIGAVVVLLRFWAT